jgi:hypothetical protein
LLVCGRIRSNKGGPSAENHRAKYYVDEPARGSSYATGNLHIIYSETEIIEKLRPKQKSTASNIVFNEEGINQPKVAADNRTIAWTETDNR